tara:strand:- start:1495 stop:2181 length:687 start_codon:yes stop_codon:yes gene_type:complete
MKNKYLKLLQKFDFEVPNFKKYKSGNIEILQEKKTLNWILRINGKEARTVNPTYFNCFQNMAMADLAYGDVNVYGYNLGTLPNWLVHKSHVKKVTVADLYEDIFMYHESHNNKLHKKINTIESNSFMFGSACDVLLLDCYRNREPFEMEQQDFINMIKNDIHLVDHKVLWFWPLEYLLTLEHNQGKDVEETYNKFKEQLPTLPDLVRGDIDYYLSMFHIDFVPLRKKD